MDELYKIKIVTDDGLVQWVVMVSTYYIKVSSSVCHAKRYKTTSSANGAITIAKKIIASDSKDSLMNIDFDYMISPKSVEFEIETYDLVL